MPLNNTLHGEVCFSICVHSRMPYEVHSCWQFPLPELYERFHKAKSWRHKQTPFSLFIAWQKVVLQQANNRKYVLLWPGIACHIYSNSRWNIHSGTDFMFAFCVVEKKSLLFSKPDICCPFAYESVCVLLMSETQDGRKIIWYWHLRVQPDLTPLKSSC